MTPEPTADDLHARIVDLWLTPGRLPAPDPMAGGRLPVPERHALVLPEVPLPSLPPVPPHPAWAAGGGAVGYRWPGDGPSVLLVHGWGGSAGQFSLWVGALLRAGYAVAAIDAPAHGASPGAFASAPAFAGTIRAFSRVAGPFDFVVAHSLGAIAATLAMADGESFRKAVFLAPCCDVEQTLFDEAARHGVGPEAHAALVASFHHRFGTDVSLATALARVPAPPPLLLLHDPADEATPYAEAVEAAASWPGARLVDVPGAGHQRILIARAAIAEATAFFE